MPESRTRKSAVEKQKLKAQQRASKPKKIKAPASRRWVPPTFITVGLLGVAWLITYYVAGTYIPFRRTLSATGTSLSAWAAWPQRSLWRLFALTPARRQTATAADSPSRITEV